MDTIEQEKRHCEDQPEGPKPVLYPQFETRPLGNYRNAGIEQENERLGLTITARTAVTRWQGERMDYGLAIDALMRAS